MASAKKKAVFLDRDGTLIEEKGYLDSPENIILFPFTAEALRLLSENGFMTIIASNQSGIARGYFTAEKVEEINSALSSLLSASGARIDDIYYCPHYPGGTVIEYAIECDCRKPGTGLIRRAADEHGIDLCASFIIGDKMSDILISRELPLRSVLVRTGYGKFDEMNLQETVYSPDFIADDLLQAARWIVENRG